MEITLCAPCLLGLEGPVADELRRLNIDGVAAENGRVLFKGGYRELARANINLACAERVRILVGEFTALSFDALFEGVKALPWEDYIPKDGAFPVQGSALDSKLFSVPDCQAIIKKAVVERLKTKYSVSWFEESAAKYQIRFNIFKDRASIYLDSSGASLHKRGYRPEGGEAPLRETLAAAMVRISRYRGKNEFSDPFCGSGTIPIEAAFAAINRAPGLLRRFDAEAWPEIPASVWDEERQAARSREYKGEYRIFGGDIDPKVIELAKENARRAGVSDIVVFETADARTFSRSESEGTIVTNPPYGERLMESREAQALYRDFGQVWRKLDSWKLYLLSSHTEFEQSFGAKADKKRKLYNGMIKCDLFMYL
jgi:putative N6-adenine-specific DNA methylase